MISDTEIGNYQVDMYWIIRIVNLIFIWTWNLCSKILWKCLLMVLSLEFTFLSIHLRIREFAWRTRILVASMQNRHVSVSLWTAHILYCSCNAIADKATIHYISVWLWIEHILCFMCDIVSVAHFLITSQDKVSLRPNFNSTWSSHDAKTVGQQTCTKQNLWLWTKREKLKFTSLTISPGTAAVKWLLIVNLLLVQL